MNVKEAVAVAKQHISGLYSEASVENLRLEEFLYDDHLGVWSLTIGFAVSPQVRNRKVVRVSEADKAILSVTNR